MGKHVIVISEDALIYEDTATLEQLPVFGSLWKKAARVEQVRSIYPTLTYPCHTTMMTGCYPDRHGIVNNELSNVKELSSDWNWFYDKVKVPSIFDRAKEKGLSTAAVFWPVTETVLRSTISSMNTGPRARRRRHSIVSGPAEALRRS